MAQTPGTDNLRGILWMLISVVGSAAMTVAVRYISVEVDSRMIVALRSGLTTGLVIIALFLPFVRHKMTFSKPWVHLIRGALIAFSTHLGFYTLSHLPLATATVLFFTAPIFATILGIVVHGEQVGPRRWGAVIAGFIGALVILRPGVTELHPAMLAALGSSLLFAGALTLSRGLAQVDGPISAYASSVVITLIITLPIAAPVYALPQSGVVWIATGILVVGGIARGIADIQAYRFADAGLLAPIAYLRLVFVGGAGFIIFNEIPDKFTAIGATMIIGSTLYIARRARKKGSKAPVSAA